MPARVVVVHDDPAFVKRTLKALTTAGYDVASFMDTISAISALETSQRIEVLITRVRFSQGQPNGVALARVARMKRPGVKVLFAARRDGKKYTEGLGEFLSAPVAASAIVKMVGKMARGAGSAIVATLRDFAVVCAIS